MYIPANYGQINHYFAGTAFPRGAQITYGLEVVGASTPAQVALEAHDLFKSAWQAAMPVTMSCTGTRCKLGPTETGPFADAGVAYAGTYNTPADSPQVAILLKKSTARGGRQGAGRMLLPIVPEASTLSGGQVDPAQVVALQTIASAWLSAVAGGTYTGFMVLLHNNPATTPDTVTSLSVQSTLATQRRRLRKVGGRRRVAP